MDTLFVTHLLNGVLMVLMPVGLGIVLARRFGLGGRLWWIGAITFVLSQVGHIPFNAAIGLLFKQGVLPAPPESWRLAFNAVFLGLSAGVWEELARYATYRWWAKEARSWRTGLMLGAGHGGIEAIILGVLVLIAFISMVAYRNIDLSGVVPPEQLGLAQQQMQSYWSAPWYATLLGALERAFTIPFHLSCSLLVLQTFIRRQSRWLWLAVGWHALADGFAVISAGIWGVYLTEAFIGMFALASLGIIFALRQPEPEQPLAPPLPVAPLPEIIPVEENPENLDTTRYQ